MKQLSILILICLSFTIIAGGCGGKKEELYQGLPLKTWVKRLNSPESEIRADALNVIAGIGEQARPAEAQVRKVARSDPSIQVRLLAIDALEAMGEPISEFYEFIEDYNKPIIPTEEEELSSLDEEMSTEDEMTAKIAEEDDLELLKAFVEGKTDSINRSETSLMPTDSAEFEEWVRQKISNEALNMINKLSNPTMLAELLSSGSDLEREFAARRLAELSGDNPDVVTALEKALEDPKEEVQRAAAQALKTWQSE